MTESDGPSNWALATAVSRSSFLLTPPRSYVWAPGDGPDTDRFWIDDEPVTEAVFDLACRHKDLPAARALWLTDADLA